MGIIEGEGGMKSLGFVAFLILCTTRLVACTGILMQTENQFTVNGRTLEFGVELDLNLAVIPRNMVFIGKTPLGGGLTYKSKYAAVGVYCFEDVVLMDGMNEKGLVAAAFYFPGYASYPKVTRENQAKALSPSDFPHWILTQFASIEEVKEALDSVMIAPTILKGWGNEPPPMHYIVYDQKGRSIVIEPLEGVLKVYENELGVITNSPTFDWHLTHLNNYIHLSPVNSGSNRLRNFQLHPFGQGTGMMGLPGDFTPPSRFVRAAFFSATAVTLANSDEAVEQTFHILNQFDIPLGAVRQKEQQKTVYDYTLLTSVKNPETLEYFYRSYQNQAIQFVSLHQFDLNAKTIRKMAIAGKEKKNNVSSMLQ
jgi:choloylglycine hydrolase